MIIAQVCLRLATIKGYSKMCSFTVLGWSAWVGMLWIGVYNSVFQVLSIPTQQLHTAIEDEWTNIPQATINKLFYLCVCVCDG